MCHRLFLSFISAELIAIRVTQVEKADLPSNALMLRNALIHVS